MSVLCTPSSSSSQLTQFLRLSYAKICAHISELMLQNHTKKTHIKRNEIALKPQSLNSALHNIACLRFNIIALSFFVVVMLLLPLCGAYICLLNAFETCVSERIDNAPRFMCKT